MRVAFIALCLMCMTVCKGNAPIKCIQGDGADTTAKDCTGDKATATKCSQPKFVEFTGMSSGVQYGCGPCAANTDGSTCESCTGKTDDACNKKKAAGVDFKCHDYELLEGKFKMKMDATTCKRLKTTAMTKCNMPGDFADKNYKVKKNGCGGCLYADKAAKRCAECDSPECNKTPIKCIQGDGSDLTARLCVPKSSEAPPKKCHQPKFIEYTGFTIKDQNYGCGDCANDKSAKCQDCLGNATTACNTKIQSVGRDFECYNYEYTDDGFVKKAKKPKVTCKRFKTTTMMCNKPGESADKTYPVQNEGHCGGCTDDLKTKKICEESDPVPIICLEGDGTNIMNKTCVRESGEEVPIKCHQTKFIQYVGLAGDLNYGCGDCPAGSESTCQECYGKTDKPCNTEIEVTTPDYKCYDYEYKDKKFAAKKDMVTCKRLKHTAPKCNMPGRNADNTNYKNNGCGGCSEEEKKALTCTECGNVKCNKAYVATITAIILPLILTLL